jgi:hypothetical protein
MDYATKILTAFELHSPEEIRSCLENGVDPNMVFEGKPLVFALINMYLRSPRFKDCVRVLVDYGLKFDDEVLLSVLLDDASLLNEQLSENKAYIEKQYSLDCAFTPLIDVSLLHICAEYNHLSCAEVLVKHGADVNARAGTDSYGFGNQTPIFHTVNQHHNNSFDVLKFLVSQKTDLGITVKGLIWGKSYEWETFIPNVNPVSYAMMGLLRQFQRTEEDVYTVVSLLMKSLYGIDYYPANIPNKYLYK